MVEIIFSGIAIAVLSAIGILMTVSEKRRHSLFPDDGIVWNEAIRQRMEKEAK